MEVVVVRTNPIRRWLLVGLIPWIGSLLLAAEIVRNQSYKSPQVNDVKETNPIDSVKERAEVLALPVSGRQSRWTLPLSGPRDGWLVAVGMAAPGAGPQKLAFSSRGMPATSAKADRATDRHLKQTYLLEDRHSSRNPVGNGLKRKLLVQSPPKKQRSFSIQTRSGDSSDMAYYEAVQADLARTGQSVTIYVDHRDQADVKPETLETIVRITDEVIPAQVISRIGDATDTDGDGRLTVLISQALNRMADGTTVLDGFVRPADFDPNVVFPRSHACDMIYINSRATSPEFLKSLLAHEFTHAVVASARLKRGAGLAEEPEESWLDEGLAHLSERWVDGSWENLDYRVSSYLLATHEHPLVINDMHGFSAARGHGHRGAAFLFLSWCQARFGPAFPLRLVQSGKTGMANLEAATGESFETLFRAWSVDLLKRSSNQATASQIRAEALLSEWLVATPKALVHELGGSGQADIHSTQWLAPATTVRLFRLVADPDEPAADHVELVLDCDEPDSVQVTVIRLTDEHHGLEVAAARVGSESSGAMAGQVRLTLTNRDPDRPLNLQAAAWEVMSQSSDARTVRQNRGFFDLLALARMTGKIKLEPGQSLVTPPIALDNAIVPDGTVVWKVVAHDPAGKPCFAWTEIQLIKPETFPPRLAERLGAGSPKLLLR